LAGRIGKASAPKPSKPSKPTKASADAEPEPEPEPEPEAAAAEPPPPPEPKWIRDLRPGDRRKATELIERLGELGIQDDQAEAVARTEIAQGLPGVARLAIERHIRAATVGSKDVDAAVHLAVEALLAGEDPDLGVSWRLVDDRGRPIEKLDLDR
jgi:hypothetical protein